MSHPRATRQATDSDRPRHPIVGRGQGLELAPPTLPARMETPAATSPCPSWPRDGPLGPELCGWPWPGEELEGLRVALVPSPLSVPGIPGSRPLLRSPPSPPSPSPPGHTGTRAHGDVHGRAKATDLVAGLGLPDEDEGVGGDDGQAEVDEDDGPLRADVPARGGGRPAVSAPRRRVGNGVLWPYRSRAPLPPHEHCCHRHHRHRHHHGHRHHHHGHHNHHSHTHQAPALARGPRGRGVAEYSSPSRCRGLIFENAPPRHARPSPRPSGPQTRLVLRAQVRLLPGWSRLGCGKGCVTPGKRPKASEPRPLPLRRARGEQRRRPTRGRVSHRQPAPRFPARPRRQPGGGRRAQSRASGAMTWPDVACELGGSRCRARSPRPDGDQGVTAKPQTAARRAEGAAPRPVPGGLGTPRPQGPGDLGTGCWRPRARAGRRPAAHGHPATRRHMRPPHRPHRPALARLRVRCQVDYRPTSQSPQSRMHWESGLGLEVAAGQAATLASPSPT